MHIPKPELDALESTSEANSDFAREFEKKHPSVARELQHLVGGVKPQTLRPAKGDRTFDSLLRHVNLTHLPMIPSQQPGPAPGGRTPESSDDEKMSQTVMDRTAMDQTVIAGGSKTSQGRGAHMGPATSTMIQSPVRPPQGPSKKVTTTGAPTRPKETRRTTRQAGVPLQHHCDLLLPEGRFVSDLDADLAPFRTPLGREVLVMRCPDDLVPFYNDEALFICNVTGVILSGAHDTSAWSELTPHQHYCSYKHLASIPTPNVGDYPSVRPIGQLEGAFPQWSFAPYPTFPPRSYVDLSHPEMLRTRFGSGYVVKYPVSKSGLAGDTILYLDPWIGDIYGDPEKASSIRRDMYLAYEGGPLPYKSPRFHKTGPSMSAELPVATPKKNWYLPDGKKLGDIPQYASTAVSPRGNKVQAMSIPPDLVSHFRPSATVAFYDEITAEVLEYHDDQMGQLFFTDIVATPRPPAEEEYQQQPPQVAPAASPRQQPPGSPHVSPNRTQEVDARAVVKAEYMKMKKHLRKVEKDEQFVLAAISDPSRRHTARGALMYLRKYLGGRIDELLETYPGLEKEVGTVAWDEGLIPDDMPESLVERVTDIYNKEVRIEDLTSQVGDLTSLPSVHTPSSVKTTDKDQGIRTQEMKNYRRYLESAARSRAKAMKSYLQYFPEPANWQDPPPHPINPVYLVGYRDKKVVQGLKETDPTKLPDQQLLHIDNIEDQRGKDLDYPRNVHFDATGKMQLDKDGEPDLPLCGRCYSPSHVQADCYVTQLIRDRKLDVDEEGNPRSCRFCKGYQHSTKNCNIWNFYRRCLFCNGDHQTTNCPTRISRDAQQLLAEANQTSVSCRSCTCDQLAAIPCYHGPEKEPPKGYHYFGLPCGDCTAKCICKYELRKDKYCTRCGDDLEDGPHRCYLQENPSVCTLCNGTDHSRMDCRYHVYEVAGEPKTCQLCQEEGHPPTQCPDFGVELMVGQVQCTVCLMTNHSHHSCPSALRPGPSSANEIYCPFCGIHSCDYHSCEQERAEATAPPPTTPARWEPQSIENWHLSPIVPPTVEVPRAPQKISPFTPIRRTQTPRGDPPYTPIGRPATWTPLREPQRRPPTEPIPRRVPDRHPSVEPVREDTREIDHYPPPTYQRQPSQPERSSSQPPRSGRQPYRDERAPEDHERPPYQPPGRGGGGGGGGDRGGGDGDGRDSPSDDETSYTTEDEMGVRVRRRRRRRRNDQLMETIVGVIKSQEGILRDQQNLLRHVAETSVMGGNTSLTEHQGNEIVEKLDVIADQATSKYLEQIGTFDGRDKQKFDNWLYDLEIVCAKFHLQPLKTAFLRSSGNLRQFLGEFTQGSDWTKIREQLIFEFSANPTVHHVEVALHRMHQGSEGLATYCKNYSRIVNQAVFKSPKEITYPLEIARFIRSLRNDKLAEKVQTKKPKTLQEAMTLAQELEKPMREREALLQFRPSVLTGNSRKDKRVMAVNRRPDLQVVKEELDKPTLPVARDEEEIPTTVKEVMNIQQGKPSKNTECYRCGKLGHWSWQCEQQGKPQQGGAPPAPLQGRLNYSATGSLPLNEGFHELLATAFQRAEQQRKEKNKYKAAWKAAQGNQNNPQQPPRKFPPKNAGNQQATPDDKTPKPAPRGGAKKFNIVPTKPATKEVTNIMTESAEGTDEEEDSGEPTRMGTVQITMDTEDDSDVSSDDEDPEPLQED